MPFCIVAAVREAPETECMGKERIPKTKTATAVFRKNFPCTIQGHYQEQGSLSRQNLMLSFVVDTEASRSVGEPGVEPGYSDPQPEVMAVIRLPVC